MKRVKWGARVQVNGPRMLGLLSEYAVMAVPPTDSDDVTAVPPTR